MTQGRIIIGNDAEDPRRQAMREVASTPYAELNRRFDSFLPQISRTHPVDQRRALFQDDLPSGASWDSRVGASRRVAGGWGNYPEGGLGPSAGAGGSMNTLQRPYQPEFSSSDRQQYPVHRVLANRYWRLFYKMDPVIGTGIDMYSEMPWGELQFTGEGIDGEVRDTYETMWEQCRMDSVLPALTREFLVVGEAIPHCMLRDGEGHWSYVAFHNPDNLEVIDAPLINMEPIVEFIPDMKLQQIVTSDDPELQRIREGLPSELLSRIYSRQNIRLNTDLNVTFIPRKLHPYETRGTSLLSRMWRVLMLEDGIFEANLATARRHAGPLKIAKLGNAQSNWIPGPEHERRFLELVAQAEMDPHAWIVYHYGLALEAFGTTDRVISVNREWDTVERIKLVAMGISKSFLTGELTFASATAGLQVFLRRILALRNFLTGVWLRPKFFRPIAKINGFVKPTTAEISHRVRTRRSAKELHDDSRYAVPKLEWAAKLNPLVDNDLIAAYEKLGKLGFRISKTKMGACAHLSFEDELRRTIEEDKLENKIREEEGEPEEKADPEDIKKIVENTDPKELQKQEEAAEANQKPAPPPGGDAPGNPRMQKASTLESVLRDRQSDDPFWDPIVKADSEYPVLELLDVDAAAEAWDALETFLKDQDIRDEDIEAYRATFQKFAQENSIDRTIDRLISEHGAG